MTKPEDAEPKKNTKQSFITNHIPAELNNKKTEENETHKIYKEVPITKSGVMNKAFKSEDAVRNFAKVMQDNQFQLFVTEKHPANMYGYVVDESECIGMFCNVQYNADTTQVSSDVHINKKYSTVIDKIDDGTYPDVSIGYFADIDHLEDAVDFTDNYSGEVKTYDHNETNMFPNHLAVLGAMEGACSVKDGCGFGAVKNIKGMNVVNGTYKIDPKYVVKDDENALADELKQKKNDMELTILELLNTFQNETGLSITYIELDRGGWSDEQSREEHYSMPVQSVGLEIMVNSKNNKNLEKNVKEVDSMTKPDETEQPPVEPVEPTEPVVDGQPTAEVVVEAPPVETPPAPDPVAEQPTEPVIEPTENTEDTIQEKIETLEAEMKAIKGNKKAIKLLEDAGIDTSEMDTEELTLEEAEGYLKLNKLVPDATPKVLPKEIAGNNAAKPEGLCKPRGNYVGKDENGKEKWEGDN